MKIFKKFWFCIAYNICDHSSVMIKACTWQLPVLSYLPPMLEKVVWVNRIQVEK